MKFLYDLLPVILFFTVFKIAQGNADSAAALCNDWLGGSFDATQAPIICATATAVIVSLLQIAWVVTKGKKPEVMLWLSTALVVVFGSLTIWLNDEMFIKWKPTVLYWLFAALLIGGTFFKKNFLKSVLGKQLALPEKAWSALLKYCIAFFVAVGVLNLIVAYSFSTDIWVDFKLFGLMGLTLLFTVGIGFYIAPYIPDKDPRGK